MNNTIPRKQHAIDIGIPEGTERRQADEIVHVLQVKYILDALISRMYNKAYEAGSNGYSGFAADLCVILASLYLSRHCGDEAQLVQSYTTLTHHLTSRTVVTGTFPKDLSVWSVT